MNGRSSSPVRRAEQMYDVAMELFEGHVHQATDVGGLYVATVYPTSDPRRWIVKVPGRGSMAEPIPAEEIE